MKLEVESSRPVTRIEIDLDDGEPAQVVTFPVDRARDGRYWRQLGSKATVEGTFPLIVRATNDAGLTTVTRCDPGITVTP